MSGTSNINGGYTNPRTAMGNCTIDNSYYAVSKDLDEYDPEYDQDPIWDQLGGILDSMDNPFPSDSIVCDDGTVITGITPKDCIDIRNLAFRFEKPDIRKEFFNRIQKSADNFKEVLEYVRSY